MIFVQGPRDLLVITMIVVFPTICALAWYHFTDDPTIRPLGITEQALRQHGPAEQGLIVAHLSWDGEAEHGSADRYANALTRAFAAKGVPVHVNIRNADGHGTYVAYDIGASYLGPFPKARAAGWINAAVEAYRMSQTHSAEQR